MHHTPGAALLRCWLQRELQLPPRQPLCAVCVCATSFTAPAGRVFRVRGRRRVAKMVPLSSLVLLAAAVAVFGCGGPHAAAQVITKVTPTTGAPAGGATVVLEGLELFPPDSVQLPLVFIGSAPCVVQQLQSAATRLACTTTAVDGNVANAPITVTGIGPTLATARCAVAAGCVYSYSTGASCVLRVRNELSVPLPGRVR